MLGLKLTMLVKGAPEWHLTDSLFETNALWHRYALWSYRSEPALIKEKASLIARFMGPTWAHLEPIGPRWAPCWPPELCYLACYYTTPSHYLNQCWLCQRGLVAFTWRQFHRKCWRYEISILDTSLKTLIWFYSHISQEPTSQIAGHIRFFFWK